MEIGAALKKAERMVKKMTLSEASSMLLYTSPEIKRLGIKEYNWWNEALHGVARAGTATVFPQAIGLAATFDPRLASREGKVIACEARAKYNQSVARNDRDIYKGLTFWSPNINIFRDPRWGRGQETFGEDPFLTSSMACAFIKGIQGSGEFLEAAACAKHFAVHSGPEGLRHGFNARVSKKELFETYLPAFEMSVKAGVVGVMGAYNAVNGVPCCADRYLIKEILRKKWGFKGYFVSDCGAVSDIAAGHKYACDKTDAAAKAINAGCEINCGDAYKNLMQAYNDGKVSEDEIRKAAEKALAIRFMLGEFEQNRPYSDVPYSKLDCKEHAALNIKAARESIVCLENRDNFLPADRKTIKNIAVIGPNADSRTALEGNYNGKASEYITVAEGMRRVFKNSRVYVESGSQIAFEKQNHWDGFANDISCGAAAAAAADLTVLCLGLDVTVEGEEGFVASEYSDKGDKKSLSLPETQQRLARAVLDECENTVIVVMAGSPLDIGDDVRKRAKAVLYAWYPGALGGLAVAEIIAGIYSPCGRLPVTFPHADDSLPDFKDYSMKGRTYRFSDSEPLYPFGYGLSYTSFSYSDVKLENKKKVKISVRVKNSGKIKAKEKVQVYAKYDDSRFETPNFQLCALKSVLLSPGEEKTVTLNIDKYWLKAVDDDGNRVVPDGKITLFVGGHQPDRLSNRLCGCDCLKLSLENA